MVGPFLQDSFGAELGFEIDKGILRGDGASSGFLGVLNSSGIATVDKQSGQAADTIQLENLLSLWQSIPARYRKELRWLINPHQVETQLYTMALEVGTGGGPVFLPGGSAANAPHGQLLGRPLVPCEQCSALGTAGDVIAFTPSQYIMVTKGDPRWDMSMHLRFDYHESTFRLTYYCGGQPVPASTTTSYKGSVDLSPFAVIQART